MQETENKLLCISKMEQSTDRVEAEKIKEVLVEWQVAEKIIACGFDTTSSFLIHRSQQGVLCYSTNAAQQTDPLASLSPPHP